MSASRSSNTRFWPASVSYLPCHAGDGYSYGGGILVTFGDRSFQVAGMDPMKGYLPADKELAHILAAAPQMLDALRLVRRIWADDDTCEEVRAIDEAIAKAEGKR